ncbi:unnamed protein product [Lathyrus sativus]|nr:unnamed protein product [Lathyrus sativus]
MNACSKCGGSRVCESGGGNDNGVSCFNHTNECYSDANWGRTLELNNPRFSSVNVATCHANFQQFVVSEIPPPAMPWSTSVNYDGIPFF